MAVAITFAAVTALLAAPAPALAYLDPASGSLILQAILGGVAGILVAGKLFWHRILLFLHIRKPDAGSGNDTDSRE